MLAEPSKYEPQHDKTNEMICVPSEDSEVWAAAQADLCLLRAHMPLLVLSWGGSNIVITDPSNTATLLGKR